MSVFTSITRPELERFLEHYAAGGLVEFEGIAAGIENTNYFVSTDQADFVLTVFEKLPIAEIPFFLELKAFLAARGLACAEPILRRDGSLLGEIQGKPAALVRRLYGASVVAPDARHCLAAGEGLARLHQIGLHFPRQRPNDRGPHWWRETAKTLFGLLAAEDEAVLREELTFQALYRFADLPRGLIHADLFRDNALFEGDRLTGIIDFYYACTDSLLFDVAVTVNDWCSDSTGALVKERAQALLDGYQSMRMLTAIERGAWPAMLRAGALRFWLSRLYDLHFPRPGEMTHTKDPEVFKRILLKRRAEATLARALLGSGDGGGPGQRGN